MEIQENIPLKNYTTFKIGGSARYFVVVKNKSDLVKAIHWAREKKLPFFVLGGGSNLLVSDKGYRGLIIKTGKPLSSYISKGLEWAAGIPGTIEGAVHGNAGAFGKSMKDVVETVEVFDAKRNKMGFFKNRDCGFAYRDSVFKRNKNLIILSVKIKLKKSKSREIKKYLNYRKSRHPKEPSAGSVFENVNFSELLAKKFPEFEQFKERGNIPAAFLISECGLKGKKSGGAVISEQHPNFILNFDNAKSKDVKNLIDLAKKSVKNKFRVDLKEEIEYL